MLQSEFEDLWGDNVPAEVYKEVIEPMYLAIPERYTKADFVNMVKPPEAYENRYDRNNHRKDKKNFIRNLGWLLAQTRLNIEALKYVYSEDGGREWVIVQFLNGATIQVDITADSYIAIIRDVCRKL